MLIATKPGRVATYHKKLPAIKPRDKLKSLYLQYHSVFDHQTWLNNDLP